jgi:uncharacterized membrane protein
VARERKTIVRMERGIGDFVVQNTALVSLALEDPPDQETIAALQAIFSISRYRTMEQDASFGIRQIVDVALKALSPGINDTTTAVMCVDYLSAILARLAPRQIPSSRRYEEGELRAITVGPTFASLLAEAFDQIRSSARGNLAIMLEAEGKREGRHPGAVGESWRSGGPDRKEKPGSRFAGRGLEKQREGSRNVESREPGLERPTG